MHGAHAKLHFLDQLRKSSSPLLTDLHYTLYCKENRNFLSHQCVFSQRNWPPCESFRRMSSRNWQKASLRIRKLRSQFSPLSQLSVRKTCILQFPEWVSVRDVMHVFRSEIAQQLTCYLFCGKLNCYLIVSKICELLAVKPSHSEKAWVNTMMVLCIKFSPFSLNYFFLTKMSVAEWQSNLLPGGIGGFDCLHKIYLITPP